MAEWRFLRGWSERELERRLHGLSRLEVSVPESPERMTEENGWKRDGIEAAIGREAPGTPVPDGLFERARRVLVRYEFSDTSIVTGHFGVDTPLGERNMLLEIKVLGLRYLVGVEVGAVRERVAVDHSVFGYRYDTLEGHIERGSEWFLLEKNGRTGDVRFRIEARWRAGDFPNWWSRVGFHVFAPYYRRRWRHRARARLARLSERTHNRPGRRRAEARAIGPPPGAEPPEPD